MNKNVILSVIGPDKPGIVSNISEIIKNHSGNIDTSRMIRLENFFTIMVLISIDDKNLKNLETDLNKDTNYKITINETNNNLKSIVDNEEETIIHLDGIDNEGLVYKITNALAELNINIEELETNITNAPMSGATLFSLIAKISHTELNYEVLSEKMNTLSDELDVNIKIQN